MNSYQGMVRGFHNALGATIGRSPALRDRELRAKLIMEEAVETVAAMGFAVTADIYKDDIYDPAYDTGDVAHYEKSYAEPHFVDAIDGLVDTIYVVLGAAVAWGIDLDPFFAEVHRANMAKLGGGMREDGKFLKPDNWTGPDITGILDREVKWGEDPSLNEWGASNG
jgi:predicted HAD superfamily Cof-like phosphohydrolase